MGPDKSSLHYDASHLAPRVGKQFRLRRGQQVTPVYSPYLCTDDFGNAVFRCRFTDQPVAIGEHRVSGNTIPQADTCYIAKRGTEAAEKASRAAFHASEGNCNMCRHFIRHAYDRRDFAIGGVFYGHCGIEKQPGEYAVAPDDWAGMPCWEAREHAA